MTKDFVKFLSLVIILYLGKCICTRSILITSSTLVLGFLTTFVLLARDSRFNAREMVSHAMPLRLQSY